MIKKIFPFVYQGSLRANTSKSYLQRALAISLLAKGKTILLNCDESKDVIAAKNVISSLGSEIKGEKTVSVESSLTDIPDSIYLNVGESGLLLRMFSVISTLFDKKIEISGEGSLLNRPIEPVIDALVSAGVKLESTNGKLPIVITSGISNNLIKLDGSFSSQIISGFLIALPCLKFNSVLEVSDLVSKPYVDMTLDIMKSFGVEVENRDYKSFFVKGNQEYRCEEYSIEGDWSGAANHLVGAAISGELKINGLNVNSKQADRAIIDAIRSFGAYVYYDKNSVYVKKADAKCFEFDATDCPDIFPPLTLLAAAASGKSVIHGINRLKYKESDRLFTIMNTFNKMGVKLKAEANCLIIEGIGKLNSAILDSFNDHRIAMISAVSACISDGEISIKNWKAVEKSYPHFFDDLLLCTTKK